MKKVIGVIMTLAMLLSVCAVPALASDNGLDISEIDKAVSFFSQDFQGGSTYTGAVLSTSNSGFSAVSHSTASHHRSNATYVVATDPVNSTNKAMQARGFATLMHLTSEWKALFDASQTSITVNGRSCKVAEYDFDNNPETAEEYALLRYNESNLYWVKKSSIANGVLTSVKEKTDLGYWFLLNADGSIKSACSGDAYNSSVKFPHPGQSAVLGELAYQFDFVYPEGTNSWIGEEGFNYSFDDVQFYVRDSSMLVRQAINLASGENTSEAKSGNTHMWTLKTYSEDAPYYVANEDYDTYLTTAKIAENGVWHTLLLRLDLVKNQYTFYIDGKPLYFKTQNGYSCKINRTASYNEITPEIVLNTERLCVYGNHTPYFDNFKGYYVGYPVKGIDISELKNATKYFSQNFDDASITEGQKVSTVMGFKQVSDSGPLSCVRFYVKGDEISSGYETSNRVMEARPNITMGRATQAQFDALRASTNTVKWGTTTYKVIDFVDGYYLASTCASMSSGLYWFKKSSVTNGSLPASPVRGVDYAQWFVVDENYNLVNISNSADVSSITIPAPKEISGGYAIQLDYAFPDNGGLYDGNEGIEFRVDSNEYHLRKAGILRSGTGSGTRELLFEEGVTSVEAETMNSMVPKKSVDIPHYFTAENYNQNIIKTTNFFDDGEWNKLMIRFNFDEMYYTFYINGLPIYAKAKNGGYSCRYKLDTKETLDTTLRINRFNVYNDRAPLIDNILGYSIAGSDEETAVRILDSIKLPYIDDVDVLTTDILFDEDESSYVTWSFDKDTYVLDPNKPLIARYNAPFGNSTSTVTLTATCKVGNIVRTRDFTLTVKDRQKYEIDSVVIKDSQGNRIYRPMDNSKIESVSLTQNSTEMAQMLLNVYDKEGKIRAMRVGYPANGKVVFNQSINEGETYKVYIWSRNNIMPLAVPNENTHVKVDNPRVYVIGDSIAATYSEISNLRGWGQFLHKIFNSNVTVDNTCAVGGRSTKWVLAEDNLRYILDRAKKGDYIFIMLGHNDMKDYEYYGATIEEYKFLLKMMIEAGKAQGVETVIVTQLARPSWHDNGEAWDTHGGYPEAAIAAAEETGSAVIDIDKLSRAELTRLGEEGTTQAGYYNPGDTHTTEVGANWVVGMIKDELSKMNLPLTEYLK